MSLLLLFNQPAAGAYTLTAAGGVYSYSGNNATLTYTTAGAFSLAADGGVYSYTGNNADLIYSGGPPPPPVAADIYFIELRSFTERRRI
jgi:hypothetical protein